MDQHTSCDEAMARAVEELNMAIKYGSDREDRIASAMVCLIHALSACIKEEM